MEESQNNLAASNSIVRAQISVTRAATGKVEHYTLEFRPLEAGSAPPPASPESSEEKPQ